MRGVGRQEPKPVVSVERPLVAEKRWAICVGAGAYTAGLAPLQFAPNDARAFAGALEERYGFDPSTVSLITDGEAKAPRAETIRAEIVRLLADKRLDRGDLFVFYFSGHGVGMPSGDYLMPTDVAEKDAERDAVPVKELIGLIVGAGLKNVLIVADACRSGAKNPFGAELQDLGRKANIAVLLGCAPGQRSYEYPRLEKGVFTHFLVKSMADAGLAEKGSGALWASAVAKKVSAQVKAYTEVDYSDDPQVPAVWSEPSQDVLLAAFPPSEETLNKALVEAGTLDRARYGRYLAQTGRELTTTGRLPEGIQTLKTLDGLGLASWRDLSLLTTALREESRDNEVGSIVARAVKNPEPDAFAEFVVLQGRPEYVGRERYRQALRAWTQPQTLGFTGAAFLVATMRMRLGDSDAEIARALAPFVPMFAPDSVEGLFLAANLALGEKKYAQAHAIAETAAAMPGGAAIRKDLRQIRYAAAQAQTDEAKIDAIIAEGLADPSDRYPWLDLRLVRMRARKDAGVTEAARAFAAGTDSDARLLSAIRALGPDAEALLPDAERLLAAHPYSWRASINQWLAASALEDFQTLIPIPDLALKYAPEKASLVSYALGQWGMMLESSYEADKISGWRSEQSRRALLGMYSIELGGPKSGPMGPLGPVALTEPDALLTMGQLLVRSHEPLRGSMFASILIEPQIQSSAYLRRELGLTALYLYINGDDPEAAKAAFGRLEKDGDLAPRGIVRYAMYRALDGDEKEAERVIGLWPSLGIGAPSPGVQAYFDVSRAYLAVRRGDKAGAQKLVDGLASTRDPAVKMLAYLTQYEIADRKGLNLEWIEKIVNPMADFTDVRTQSLRALVEGYGAMPGEEAKKRAAQFSILLGDTPGLRRTREIGFENKTGLGLYTGISRWEGTLSDGVGKNEAEMFLGITPSGNASVTIKLPSLPAEWSGTGEVDERGNLFVDLKDKADGKDLGVMAMKIPPTGFEKRDPVKGGAGFQAIVLNNPLIGLQLTLKYKQSATNAEFEAAQKPKTNATKPPVKKPGQASR